MRREMLQISVIVSFCMAAYAQDSPIRVDFSATMPAEVIGAGFGTLPKADISYGSIRTDNAFDGATDGVGATIVADPGEGVMIYGQTLTTPHAAIIRCSVRADGPEAEVTIVAVDRNWQYFTTSGPVDSSPLTDRYRRVSVLYVPPTTGFTPILQVYNPSETTTVTVYVDNFDVYLLTPGRYYDAEFLDGDDIDPAVISIEPGGGVEPLPTPPPLEGTETLLWDSFVSAYVIENKPALSDARKIHDVVLNRMLRVFVYATEYTPLGSQARSSIKVRIETTGEQFESPDEVLLFGGPVIYSDPHLKKGLIEVSLPETLAIHYPEIKLKPYGRNNEPLPPPDFAALRKMTELIEFIGSKFLSLVPYSSIVMDPYQLASILTPSSDDQALSVKNESLFQDLNTHDIGGSLWDPGGFGSGVTGRFRAVELIVPLRQTRTEAVQLISVDEMAVFFAGEIQTDSNAGKNDPVSQVALLNLNNIGYHYDNPPVKATPTPAPEPPTPGQFTGELITIPLDLPAGAKPLEMVLIPAGTFTMGSPASERGRYSSYEWLPHEVTISTDFYLGKYEVTVGQYAAFLRATGKESGVDWSDSDCPLTRSGGNYELRGTFGQSWDQPMVEVSWYGAAMFCNYMSQKQGLQPVYDESSWEADLDANGYRLPTEAEWEYACRAGTTTRFSFGDALECDDGCGYCEIFDQHMWWCGNNSPSGTKEVGLKLPNPWGLCDMHGNVWEWCSDWWRDPYDRGPQVDPTGQESGSYRVIRGGNWYNNAWWCRSAFRCWYWPVYTLNYIGFRVLVSSRME